MIKHLAKWPDGQRKKIKRMMHEQNHINGNGKFTGGIQQIWAGRKKEQENMKVVQLKLSSLKNKKEKNEEKLTEP